MNGRQQQPIQNHGTSHVYTHHIPQTHTHSRNIRRRLLLYPTARTARVKMKKTTSCMTPRRLTMPCLTPPTRTQFTRRIEPRAATPRTHDVDRTTTRCACKRYTTARPHPRSQSSSVRRHAHSCIVREHCCRNANGTYALVGRR